jgi:hypothetical protein
MRKQASIIFVVLIVIGVAALYFSNKNGDQTIGVQSQVAPQVKVVDKPDYTQTNTQPEQATTTPEQTIDPEKDLTDYKLWKLVHGDALDTCTTPTFTGKVSLRGYYGEIKLYPGVDYGDAPAWAFFVIPDDIKRLPMPQIYTDKPEYAAFIVSNPTPALVTKWKAASVDNPATIVVTKFSQYCEGNGEITIQR